MRFFERYFLWEFLVAGLILAAFLASLGCGSFKAQSTELGAFKTSSDYAKTRDSEAGPVTCKELPANPSLDERMERVEAVMNRVDAGIQAYLKDRAQAERNAQCIEECERIHGEWSRAESDRKGELRSRCYSQCHRNFKMPPGMGGGC